MFSRFSHNSAPSGPLQPQASACHAGRTGGEPVETGVGTERAEVRGRPSPPNPSPCLPATRPRWTGARQRRNSSARAASRAKHPARNRGRSRPRRRSRPAAPKSTSSPSPGRTLAPAPVTSKRALDRDKEERERGHALPAASSRSGTPPRAARTRARTCRGSSRASHGPAACTCRGQPSARCESAWTVRG